MKRISVPLLAAIILVVVLGGLHFSGILNRNSVQAEIDQDVVTMKSAFDTVDLQQAMKVVTFDPPKMLNPPDVMPPALKYPPSADALAAMSGP